MNRIDARVLSPDSSACCLFAGSFTLRTRERVLPYRRGRSLSLEDVVVRTFGDSSFRKMSSGSLMRGQRWKAGKQCEADKKGLVARNRPWIVYVRRVWTTGQEYEVEQVAFEVMRDLARCADSPRNSYGVAFLLKSDMFVVLLPLLLWMLDQQSLSVTRTEYWKVHKGCDLVIELS